MSKPKSKAKPKNQKAKPRGRPSDFNEGLALRLLELATKGATDAEMADAAGISERTFNTWKRRHPDFLQSLKTAKAVADELVEASLFQRAVGYSHPAVKFVSTKFGIEPCDYIEHYPPDTTAGIFWLKNRQPDRWRDVHKLEHTGKDGAPIATVQVTQEAINKAAREALTGVGEPSENY